MPVTARTSYGQIVTAKLRQKLVTGAFFNRDYQGDANAGTVMIPTTPEDVVRAYDKNNIGNNTVSYDANAWIPALVDQDVFIDKYLDGYNVASLPYNVIADNLDRAGYAIAKAMDTHGITTLVRGAQGLDKNGNAFTSADPRYDAGGNYGIIKSVGSSDVYDVLTDLSGEMTDAGVPEEDRYLGVNGDFKAKILQSNKAIRQGQLSQELILKGVIAEIAGFEVYATGQVSGTIGSDKLYAIAGHPAFATRVESFKVEPAVFDGNGDANIVGGVLIKGRYVFTHEVQNPKAFGLITA